METKSDLYFRYPPNLHVLDLATMVNMYRERGEPHKAKAGQYLACAATRKLIKEGKWWFGMYYSQSAWNDLLTKGCEGYPLTKAELNIMGMAVAAEKDDPPTRQVVEEHCGTIPKLAFMIVNDLKEFGFINITEDDRILITPRGEKALQGIARRIYAKKFSPDMLPIHEADTQPGIERARKKQSDQKSLF